MYREDTIHKLSVSCTVPWPKVSRYTIISCIVTSLVGTIGEIVALVVTMTLVTLVALVVMMTLVALVARS